MNRVSVWDTAYEEFSRDLECLQLQSQRIFNTVAEDARSYVEVEDDYRLSLSALIAYRQKIVNLEERCSTITLNTDAELSTSSAAELDNMKAKMNKLFKNYSEEMLNKNTFEEKLKTLKTRIVQQNRMLEVLEQQRHETECWLKLSANGHNTVEMKNSLEDLRWGYSIGVGGEDIRIPTL